MTDRFPEKDYLYRLRILQSIFFFHEIFIKFRKENIPCVSGIDGTILYIFTFITFYFLIKISFIQRIDLRHFKILFY